MARQRFPSVRSAELSELARLLETLVDADPALDGSPNPARAHRAYGDGQPPLASRTSSTVPSGSRHEKRRGPGKAGASGVTGTPAFARAARSWSISSPATKTRIFGFASKLASRPSSS